MASRTTIILDDEARAAARQLVGLFEGNDPGDEIRRLKAEDSGF